MIGLPVNRSLSAASAWFTTRTPWQRTALVLFSALVLAHGFAAWGVKLGLPEAPYGDERRHLWIWLSTSLRTVWLPWEPLSLDAADPAWLARMVLPVTLFWLMAEAVAALYRNLLRPQALLRHGAHYVLSAPIGFALRLGELWVGQGRGVVAACASTEHVHQARSRGLVGLPIAWGTMEAFRRCALDRAEAVLIAGAADLANVEAARATSEFVAGTRAATLPPLLVLLEVNDPFLRARIGEHLDRFGHLESAQLRILAPAHIAARRLLREYPFDRLTYAERGIPHVCIVGLSRLGEELLLAVLRIGHFMHREPMTVTVVAPNADDARASLQARWPGIEGAFSRDSAPPRVGARECDEPAVRLRFVAVHPEDVDAWVQDAFDVATDPQPPPTAVYFCLDADETNAGLALALCRAFERAQRTVPTLYLRRNDRASGALPLELVAADWLASFGDGDWVADAALSTLDELDVLARRIHERYLAEALARGEPLGSRRSLQPWLLLDEDLKDDNRTLADHHYVKLRDCGCRVTAAGASSEAFAFDANEVEALARTEHVRWMANRRLAGWRYASTRDDEARLHPDMVPYSALPEPRKDLDRAVVRELPGMFAEIARVVTRDVRVRVFGPRSHWAFASEYDAAVERVLARLKTSAGDRMPVLCLGLHSALACRVAEMALDRRLAALELTLEEGVPQVLGRVTDAGVKARMRRLLRAAERVSIGVPSIEGAAARSGAEDGFVVTLALAPGGPPGHPSRIEITAGGMVRESFEPEADL